MNGTNRSRQKPWYCWWFWSRAPPWAGAEKIGVKNKIRTSKPSQRGFQSGYSRNLKNRYTIRPIGTIWFTPIWGALLWRGRRVLDIHKKSFIYPQKRPVYPQKELYISTKEPNVCAGCSGKDRGGIAEPYKSSKRDLYIRKKALYICAKEANTSAKEPCICAGGLWVENRNKYWYFECYCVYRNKEVTRSSDVWNFCLRIWTYEFF